MKLIFSRKGFDSGYGGVPSPVLPRIGPLSLPIPSMAGEPAEIYKTAGVPLGTLLSDLTRGKYGPTTQVHLDPDLESSDRPRHQGWRPALGQVASAQSHLANHGVGPGDLFLFFGWFRPAEWHAGAWRFVHGSSSFHALFGWLQVAEIVTVPDSDTNQIPPWLRSHPHVAHAARFSGKANAIYTASDELRLSAGVSLPGGGRLKHWTDALILSAEGSSRSIWSLPQWLDPRQGRKPLSYHGRLDRWSTVGERVQLQTVAKGQEFVLDCAGYPEATSWLSALIEDHAACPSDSPRR